MSAIPSKLARAAAAQTWPDVQRQTRIAPGVFGFDCAGHGGIVAVIATAQLSPTAVEAARSAGLIDTVFHVKNPRRSRTYLASQYDRAELDAIAASYPDRVTVSDVWIAEEDCDWSTVFYGNGPLLEAARGKYLSEHVTMEDVNDSVRRWNAPFVASLGGECRDCGEAIPMPANASKYHTLCGSCWTC